MCVAECHCGCFAQAALLCQIWWDVFTENHPEVKLKSHLEGTVFFFAGHLAN